MGPLALSPRVAALTLMQGFRLHSGSTDAADVAIINMLLFFVYTLVKKVTYQTLSAVFAITRRCGLSNERGMASWKYGEV